MLTTRFMTIVEQRHIVPKLSKRVFAVFVKYLSDLKDFLPRRGIGEYHKDSKPKLIPIETKLLTSLGIRI